MLDEGKLVPKKSISDRFRAMTCAIRDVKTVTSSDRVSDITCPPVPSQIEL